MMLGKTNILFVSKSDASEAQLVQEKILTASAGTIWKIEYLNDRFFAYTSDKEVLCGTDVRSLAYIKKDGKNLEATHFIYHEGTYYFCNAYAGSKLRYYVYATRDFIEYEEVVIEEDEDESFDMFSLGIFKDSQGRIIVVTYKYKHTSSVSYVFKGQSGLHILRDFDDRQDEVVIRSEDDGELFVSTESDGRPSTDARLIKDRIISKTVCDLSGNVYNPGQSLKADANDYFFRHTCKNLGDDKTPDFVIDKIYRSLNGLNWSECLSFTIGNAFNWLNRSSYTQYRTPVFAINGKTCLIYRREQRLYVNIADGVEKIGDSSNPTFEIDLIEFEKIEAVCEDGEGNTYLGFEGGIIVKLYLDQDGTTQLPDVQMVKTLAARQALAQAKQYTDEKAAELKAYFDSSMGQQ